MRTIVIALMLVLSLAALTDRVAAQTRQFPYDAVILDEEVYARSGPGRQYYPTSRFRKGDRVNVLRHDPGGWFMIEPPSGSFAWVRQEFVKRDGDRGTIVSDSQVVAWVGTSFGEDHFVEQRRLQRGEEVEILAEKTLKDDRGDVPYVKIKSPKGHYRWIPGAKVTTSEKQLAAQPRAKSGDPFDTGAGTKSPDSSASPIELSNAAPVNPLGADAKNSAPPNARQRAVPTPIDLEDSKPDASSQQKGSVASKGDVVDSPSPFASSGASDGEHPPGTSPVEDRIAAVDDSLREMLKRDTRDWDFREVEAELQSLQTKTSTADAASRRLASLQKYKQIKADYDDFARIMEATNRRDAELAAAQGSTMPNTVPAIGSTSPATPRSNGGARAQPGETSASPAIRTRENLGNQPSSSKGNSFGPSSSASKPKLSGAGVVQRSNSRQPGVPKHVLVHPSGRVLAYLQGDGVDLDKYLGESMGIVGERSFRKELGADVLIVRSVQPVRLKP